MTAPCHHGVPDTETCAWLTFLLTSGWPVRSACRRTAWRQYRRPPTLTFASSSPVGNSSRSSPGVPAAMSSAARSGTIRRGHRRAFHPGTDNAAGEAIDGQDHCGEEEDDLPPRHVITTIQPVLPGLYYRASLPCGTRRNLAGAGIGGLMVPVPHP